MMLGKPSKLDIILMGTIVVADIIIGAVGFSSHGWLWTFGGPWGTSLLAILWMFLRPGWINIGRSRGRRETLGLARQARRFHLTLDEWLDAELDRDIAELAPKIEKLRKR